MESTAPDPEHPHDTLRTVFSQPKSSRSLNPPERPAPPANLMDDLPSVRESPGPKGKGKAEGKSKGDTGKGERGKSDKGRDRGQGK